MRINPIQHSDESTSTPEQPNFQPPTWIASVSGAASGALSAIVAFPFEGLKKRIQSQQPMNAQAFHPRNLYRGVFAFASSVSPTTMFQETVGKSIKSFVPAGFEENTIAQLANDLASGSAGALISTPVEHTILRQQLDQSGPTQAVKQLLTTSWKRPWTGLPQLAAREAVFTVCYRNAEKVKNEVAKTTESEHAGHAAELGVGVAGALLSHPFDTIATHRQRSTSPISGWKAAVDIFTEQGIKGFYKGGAYRVGLFTTCMVGISKTKEVITESLESIHRKTRSDKKEEVSEIEKIDSTKSLHATFPYGLRS